jgi:hypothetical protein
MVIWYIFSHFGMLHEEKSGNPAHLPFSTEIGNEAFACDRHYWLELLKTGYYVLSTKSKM